MSSSHIVDDNDAAVIYLPAHHWHTDSRSDASQQTTHTPPRGMTSNATFSFEGNGIELVGFFDLDPTLQQPPDISCAVDGANIPLADLTSPKPTVTFCSVYNLPSQSHSFQFFGDGGAVMWEVSFDYFRVITSTPATAPGPTTHTTSPPDVGVTHTTSPPDDRQASQTQTASGTDPTITPTVTSTSGSAQTTDSIPTNTLGTSKSTGTSDPTAVGNIGTQSTIPLGLGSGSSTPFGSSPTGLTNAGSEQASGKHGGSIGVIVGAVVGGLVLVALLVVVYIVRRRSSRRQAIETYERTAPLGTWGRAKGMASLHATPPRTSAEAHLPEADSHLYTYNLASPSQIGLLPRPESTFADPNAHAFLSEKSQDSSSYGSTHLTSPTTPTAAPAPAFPTASPLAGQTIVDGTLPVVQSEASRSPWYAPPGWHARAQSLLSVLSAGGRRAALNPPLAPLTPNRGGVDMGQQPPPPQHQDSGLRLYSDNSLPPPYTPE